MKKFLTFSFVVVWCFTISAQNKLPDAEYSPNSSTVKGYDFTPTEAMWDVLLEFDVTALTGAAGNAGAEWDGTYFYTTRWASNLIHKYNSSGTTLVQEFSVPGVSGLRDLAYDGTYFYGGAAGTTIYQMTFDPPALIGTISSPVNVRHIAYDPTADGGNGGFWVGDWSSPIYLISRTGATLATIPAATHGLQAMYGSAFDDVSPGGPFLWVFDQGPLSAGPQAIYQLQLPAGTPTGVMHDVLSDVGIGNPDGIAGGLFIMSDFAPNMLTLGGLLQGTPDEFFVYELGPLVPCPAGAASNPSPVPGATNVPQAGVDLTWTNGAGTTMIEVWFGEAGNMELKYDGAPITSYNTGSLAYFTNYQWRIISKNDTCSTTGPLWSFKTEQNPLLVTVTENFYPQNADYWTGSTDGSTKTDVSEVRGRSTEDGWFMFDITGIPDGAVIDSIWFFGYVNETNWPYWSATPLPGLNPLTATAAELKSAIEANSAQGVAYIYANETSGFAAGTHSYKMGSNANADLQAALTQNWFAMGMDSRDNSATYYLEWDGWNQSNTPYLQVTYSFIVPVELVSFTASVSDGKVNLSWATASETNNYGFEVERKAKGQEYTKVGFVSGFGTTTETQVYSFTDNSVTSGVYTYRLKQVDFDGTFEYSNEVEVDLTPSTFNLSQNYPNPFNPATTISFSLASDSKVTLKVFDILGQEVATLVNGNMNAGVYNINFNASALNSGVYFYTIEAAGVDGTNFTSTKKMMLTK